MGTSEKSQKPRGADAIDCARRRLLAKAVYVPPMVIGALALSQEGCQAASCNPSTCNPATCGPSTLKVCHPNGGPCGPDTTPCTPNSGA